MSERLLHGIESPADLRRLPREQVEQVAAEIRAGDPRARLPDRRATWRRAWAPSS